MAIAYLIVFPERPEGKELIHETDTGGAGLKKDMDTCMDCIDE